MGPWGIWCWFSPALFILAVQNYLPHSWITISLTCSNNHFLSDPTESDSHLSSLLFVAIQFMTSLVPDQPWCTFLSKIVHHHSQPSIPHNPSSMVQVPTNIFCVVWSNRYFSFYTTEFPSIAFSSKMFHCLAQHNRCFQILDTCILTFYVFKFQTSSVAWVCYLNPEIWDQDIIVCWYKS